MIRRFFHMWIEERRQARIERALDAALARPCVYVLPPCLPLDVRIGGAAYPNSPYMRPYPDSWPRS